MTDTRLPERYLNDRRLQRLSDPEFRSYISALVWSVLNRTDGRLEPEDLEYIPGCRAESASSLVARGLWETKAHGWTITDFAATQTSASELEVLENLRRRDREAKARKRADKPSPTVPTGQSSVPGTVQGTSPGDGPMGQHRQEGQEGQEGKDRPRGEGVSVPATSREVRGGTVSHFNRRPLSA